MKSISFKDKIEKDIVETIQSNEQVHDAINNVVKDHFVEKETFDQRFDRILAEMRSDREESARNREENARNWDENTKEWAESRKRWEENDRKWHENQKVINDLISNLKIVEINDEKLEALFDQTVGALGARWGIRSEQSFRSALKGILEKNTEFKVLHVVERDESGVVFGRPEQIELDIVIKNGKLLIIEIKIIGEFRRCSPVCEKGRILPGKTQPKGDRSGHHFSDDKRKSQRVYRASRYDRLFTRFRC